MKFVVLALCVCAASAATFPRGFGNFGNFAKASATVSVQPPVVVPEDAPYAVPPVYPAVKAVQPVKTEAYANVAKTYANDAKTYANVAKTYVNDGKDVNAEVLRSNSEVGPDGFSYNYETSNGIAAEAQGTVKELEKGVSAVVVRGQYQYQGPDGPVVVTYVADENGYQPSSDLLPVAPPVPEAILRSLQYIETHAPKDEVVRKF